MSTLDAELHIAGVVVRCAPSRVSDVAASVSTLAGAQVHATDARGKVVVTLEAGSQEVLTRLLLRIQGCDGVLSAAIVYQCADTLESMHEEMPDAPARLR